MLRVLTWNIAGRSNRVSAQVDAIQSIDPDVIALQEVTHRSLGALLDGLVGLGFQYSVDSFQFVQDAEKLVGPRRYGELISSRLPLRPIPPGEFDIPWPERVLSCWLCQGEDMIEFHTTYVPPGSTNGWIKIETFEGIYRRLARDEPHARILCGDFNSPNRDWAMSFRPIFSEHLPEYSRA